MIYRTGFKAPSEVEKGLKGMYRKATCFLVMGSFVFMACFLCLKGIDVVKLWSEPVLELGLQEVEEKAEELEMQWEHKMRPPFEDRIRGLGIADVAVSGQRTVGYSVMEQNYVYRFSRWASTPRSSSRAEKTLPSMSLSARSSSLLP